MSYFNPVEKRASFESFALGYISGTIQRAASVPENGKGNAATNMMPFIAYAYVVNLQSEIRLALENYHTWFEDSITRNEQFGDFPDAASARRDGAYGLCCWLLDNKNRPEIFSGSCDHWDKAWAKAYRYGANPNPPQQVGGQVMERTDFVGGVAQDGRARLPARDQDILADCGDYLACCAQSGEYARGIALYERVGGETDIDPKLIRCERTMGYWLLKARAEGRISEDEIVATGTRFLKTQLQSDWLVTGQSVLAATWLKIIFWHTGMTKTPLETILKAYDCMPKVPRPVFV
jgi:hypothetical protein